MPKSHSCPKCAGTMTLGFIADATYGAYGVAKWVAGEAEKSVWTGIKIKGKEQRDVESWRCNRCGFIENYAP